jgi:hypothetical protein
MPSNRNTLQNIHNKVSAVLKRVIFCIGGGKADDSTIGSKQKCEPALSAPNK